MTEYTFENEINEELDSVIAEAEAEETAFEEENLSSDGRLTPLRILESIEMLNNYDMGFTESITDKILLIRSDIPGDQSPFAKAQALKDIVALHEETTRHKLGILREMYQDVKDKY